MKKYKEIFEDIELLKCGAEYIDGMAKNIIGKPYGEGSFIRFDNIGAIFSYERNNSCHCHTEYQTIEYIIPFEWIDAIITKYIIPPEQNIGETALGKYENESLDYSQASNLLHQYKIKLDEGEIKERERINLEKEAKRIAEKIKMQKETEARERAELTRLSKKYS